LCPVLNATQNKHLATKINTQEDYSKSNKTAYGNNRIIYSLAFLGTIYAKERDDNETNQTSKRNRFNFIADAVEPVMPSIVQIEATKHVFVFGIVSKFGGSWFIVSEDGTILTNAHVIRDTSHNISVKLTDGRCFRARIVKIDISSDLAVIKIDCLNLKPVKLGDSDKIRTGEFVVALGSPLTLSNTVTSGVVSNPSRNAIELGLLNK